MHIAQHLLPAAVGLLSVDLVVLCLACSNLQPVLGNLCSIGSNLGLADIKLPLVHVLLITTKLLLRINGLAEASSAFLWHWFLLLLTCNCSATLGILNKLSAKHALHLAASLLLPVTRGKARAAHLLLLVACI